MYIYDFSSGYRLTSYLYYKKNKKSESFFWIKKKIAIDILFFFKQGRIEYQVRSPFNEFVVGLRKQRTYKILSQEKIKTDKTIYLYIL